MGIAAHKIFFMILLPETTISTTKIQIFSSILQVVLV